MARKQPDVSAARQRNARRLWCRNGCDIQTSDRIRMTSPVSAVENVKLTCDARHLRMLLECSKDVRVANRRRKKLEANRSKGVAHGIYNHGPRRDGAAFS